MRSARRAAAATAPRNPYNCIDTPNPLPKVDTVWLEEMTWMDVRDAMKAGKTTVIISTGGIEPNGPWLALGKHNYVLRANCDAIARKLGDAICAPDRAVRAGRPPRTAERSHDDPGHDQPDAKRPSHALLSDIVISYKVHGFENIMMIGDSGGNGRGMSAVATKYTELWNGEPVVAHIPQHYDYNVVSQLLGELGVTKPAWRSDGLHDDPSITMNMFVTDPKSSAGTSA